MSNIARNTTLYLLKNIPFDKGYTHTRYFSSESDRDNWILSTSNPDHVISKKEAQNYIKNPLSGTIRVAGHEENYLDCNYICFQNTKIDSDGSGTYGNQIKHYAFVDDLKYVSNSVFEIDYTIDVVQTYLIGHTGILKECMVLRENVSDDDFGKHIEPEPIVSDRYVYNNIRKSSFYDADLSKWSVLVYASKARSEGNNIKSMGVRDGLPQGLYCNVFMPDDSSVTNPQTAYEKFVDWMNSRSDDEYADWSQKIVAIVAVPSEFIDQSLGGLKTKSTWNSSVYVEARITDVDGYTPVNKKLLTYPYNGHYLTDQDGNTEDIAYEFMSINNSGNMRFKLAFAVQPQPECVVAPYGYKGYPQGNVNYDAKMVIKNFPMIPWVADAYKQYLGSQGMSNAYNIVSSGVKGAIGGALMGNPLAGSALGVIDMINRQGLQGRQASMGADDVHLASNSAMWALGEKTIMDCQKCICKEDAKRIDMYFTQYGYAVNTLKKPDFTNTKFFHHFVQTQNCIISGGAPASVCEKLQEIFNRGITFWDSDSIGNYINNTNGNIITRS